MGRAVVVYTLPAIQIELRVVVRLLLREAVDTGELDPPVSPGVGPADLALRFVRVGSLESISCRAAWYSGVALFCSTAAESREISRRRL